MSGLRQSPLPVEKRVGASPTELHHGEEPVKTEAASYDKDWCIAQDFLN